MESIVKAIETLIAFPTIKAGITVLTAFIGYIFGLNTVELWFIIGVLVVLDTSTGILKARKKQEQITSRRMFDKLAAVAVYGIVIGFVNMLARSCSCLNDNCPEQVASILRSAAVFWIISTESKSIVENLHILGVKIGGLEEFIQKYLGDKQQK